MLFVVLFLSCIVIITSHITSLNTVTSMPAVADFLLQYIMFIFYDFVLLMLNAKKAKVIFGYTRIVGVKNMNGLVVYVGMSLAVT